MLAIGCSFYNDKEGVERLLESCWKHVDLCFMVDGPYLPTGLYDSDTSTDGSAELVDRYPNTILCQQGGRAEPTKRMNYIELCDKYKVDYLIVVDSDEYFYDCDWNAFADERERICNDKDHLYNLKNFTEISYDGINKTLVGLDQPRLIHWPTMIYYLNGHHYQFAINGTDDAIVAKNTLYSVKLCHDPHLRTQERKDKHDEYIRWLKRYELEREFNESPKEKENRLLSVWSGN